MRFIIVGAGAAGLAAARFLRDRGNAVVVLEARPRTGGRIWTDRIWAGGPLEHGAEFVHGDRAVTWRHIQGGTSAGIAYGEESEFRVLQDGSVRMVRELPNDFQRALKLEYAELPKVDRLDDLAVDAWLAELGLEGTVATFAGRFLADIWLTTPDELSVLALAQEARMHHAGRGHFRVRGGYDQVVTALGSDLDIRLATEVLRIHWGKKGAEVETNRGRFAGDAVIVTVPLALLQEGTPAILPALPPEATEAIRALRMGTAVKIHLQFRKRWWPEDLRILMVLGEFSAWWDTSYQRTDIPPVLTGLITGPRTKAWDAWSDAEAFRRALDELKKAFPLSDPHGAFVRGTRVAWSADPWSRGAYSYVPVGASGARELLARPVGDVLMFAGEAVAWDSDAGTVHGAMESGVRAATALLEARGLR